MQALFRYFKTRAERKLADFMRSGNRDFIRACSDSLTDELASKLLTVSRFSFESLLMRRLAKEKLLLAYIREDPGRLAQIRAVKENILDALKRDDDSFLSANMPNTLGLIQMAEQQYFGSLQEFCSRFSEHKDEIEWELLDGRRITAFRSLRIRIGDEHDHGRATALAVTNAGSFIYRPRSVEIDREMETIFLRFFPDIGRLPHCISFDGYGYSEYIENSPASCDKDAGQFYYRIGALCAVLLLFRSRDFHEANILACGTCPVPVDLEMMISPLETGVKMGAAPKDIHWENTVCGTGFLSYKAEGHEIGVLFSDEPLNKSAPVIDGVRQKVPAFRQNFLQGFAAGYRRVLDRKQEICDAIRAMPRLKVRVLMRGTQAYGIMSQRIARLDPEREIGLNKDLHRALSLGFDKLGEKRQSAIVESEIKAVLERNIPVFYTYSDDHGLWDAEQMLYADYFERSCVENLVRTVTDASEQELRFELALLNKAMDREITAVKKQPNGEVLMQDAAVDFLAAAQSLARAIMDDAIESPAGKKLWFSVNGKYSMPMNCDVGFLGRGDSGIALFFCALASRTEDAQERQRLLRWCDDIMLDKIDMIDRLDRSGAVMAENVLSPGLENGIAGLFLANEFIEYYGRREYCGRFRDLLIRVLRKMDLSHSKNGMFGGLAGLIRVLCSFDALYTDITVKGKLEEMCGILMARRTADRKVWPDENERDVLPAAEQCGIGAALRLVGERLGRLEYTYAAEETFPFADACYDEDRGTWISRGRYGRRAFADLYDMADGVPGIGLALKDAKSEPAVRNFGRAVSACMRSGLSAKDSLADGNCAAVDFLLKAGESLGRPDLAEAAAGRMKQIVLRADRAGYRYLKSEYENFFEAGLLYGAAGVGYTCLRCADPNYFKSIF